MFSTCRKTLRAPGRTLFCSILVAGFVRAIVKLVTVRDSPMRLVMTLTRPTVEAQPLRLFPLQLASLICAGKVVTFVSSGLLVSWMTKYLLRGTSGLDGIGPPIRSA